MRKRVSKPDTKSKKFSNQLSYEDRQKARGLVKVGAWVPFDERDTLLDYAEILRKKADATAH